MSKDNIFEIIAIILGKLGAFLVWVGMGSVCILFWYYIVIANLK